MRNRFVRLVAHIRQPKSLSTDLAVTGINHQMMFFPQPSGEVENVYPLTVFHAGERLRAESFLGKKIESNAAHPIMHKPICACVTSITRFEAFLENFVQLELERVNVSDARRARCHPLSLLASELQEIEIKSAIRNFVGSFERFVRNRKQRKARRERECFLRSSKHYVDPKPVHVDLNSRKR